MTKARDLANLLDANGDVKSASLDNVPAVDLTNLSASNLTSGTIPDARVSASAVSQHATSFDDTNIINDLSTVALRSATTENAVAYNTNSSFIDVFQDSSGIGTATNAGRGTDEYIGSIYSVVSATASEIDIANPTPSTYQYKMEGSWTQGASSYTEMYTGYFPATAGIATNSLHSYANTTGASQIMRLDYKEVKNFGGSMWIGGMDYTSYVHQWKIRYSENGSDYFPISFANATHGSRLNQNASYQKSFSSGDAAGAVNLSGTGGSYSNWAVRIDNVPDFNARYIECQILNTTGGNSYYAMSIFQPFGYFPTTYVNASGNVLSNVITAPSSTSKMGAIITYQDNAGTNALNTDIVLQLSADNGANFTTATLTALPNYSTGIKMAKVNDLSVTAGTQLKYKISFANQASGSKEARVRGVSLQY